MPGLEPKNRHAQYAKNLKNKLPAEAFKESPRKLLQCLLHLTLILAAYTVIRDSSVFAAYLIASVVIGHSLCCIAFLAHELSHGAIIKRSKYRSSLELLLWGLNIIPATMWKRIHNHTHHKYGNTPKDTDRFFTKAELEAPEGKIRRLYVQFFFPHRYTSYLNPLIWFHFITYIARHLLAVFYTRETRPTIVTYKPEYNTRHRIRIVFEVVFIVFIQYLIFLYTGANWQKFLLASPIPILLTSSFVMAYVWTNHYSHGLSEVHDPIKSSTSVIVPSFIDSLHARFSYHTEHHIFPSMNSDYFPMLSELIKKEYPDIYNRVPITEAWSQLFKNNRYAD